MKLINLDRSFQTQQYSADIGRYGARNSPVDGSGIDRKHPGKPQQRTGGQVAFVGNPHSAVLGKLYDGTPAGNPVNVGSPSDSFEDLASGDLQSR